MKFHFILLQSCLELQLHLLRILTFLSAGILTPEILNFRVSYVDLSCSASTVNSIPERPQSEDFGRPYMQTRFAAMYDQMQKSLRSDGLASRQRLRGAHDM